MPTKLRRPFSLKALCLSNFVIAISVVGTHLNVTVFGTHCTFNHSNKDYDLSVKQELGLNNNKTISAPKAAPPTTHERSGHVHNHRERLTHSY